MKQTNITLVKKLLTRSNTKLEKSAERGWISFGMHLSPHTLSGRNTCPHASPGCAAACLNTAGHGAFQFTQRARLARTRWFFSDRASFMEQLISEIRNGVKYAAKKGMRPCFRLNLTSDLAWESIKAPDGRTVLEHFPDVQFYDYTKSVSRVLRSLNPADGWPPNYHLTFSRSETNDIQVGKVLAARGSVAVVFAGSLPRRWTDRKVVDGDRDDLRFLDPRNVIVGLKMKGRAIYDASGFVVPVKKGAAQ